VASFVRTCRAEGLRLVLVITGRGLHSKSEPVLRHEVPQWLRIDCAGDVQEVVKAPPELGREGALLVVLRPIRPDGEQAPEREPD
jgi:DNA-nicking Smr family endonuclease